MDKTCEECRVCEECTSDPKWCDVCEVCQECDLWDGKATWAGSECVPPNRRKKDNG